MKAYLLRVHGLVQGVFFRKHTKEKAGEFNVSGYVRNCEDGSVEVFAEGDELQVRLFIEWCHIGPRGARVSKVDIHEQPLKNSRDFIIAH